MTQSQQNVKYVRGYVYIRPFSPLNQQLEYKVLYELMCWLSGSLTCRLSNVMWSPPARKSLVSSITVDWFLAPRRWGFYFESKSTNYPDHGHHGDPPTHKENPHGRAGNRTRNLVISSQKLWPLDHEAGLILDMEVLATTCKATPIVMQTDPQ